MVVSKKNCHQPVLLKEVVGLLNPQPKKVFLDATLGHGGHSLPLLQAGATVFGLDADPQSLQTASRRLASYPNFHPIHDNFKNLLLVYQKHLKTPLDGILFDLGLSQNQITGSNRGFSFNDQASLDMRLDPSRQILTAENIINTYSFPQLFDLFTKFAQEKLAKPLIQRIISSRQEKPITSGRQLGNIIRSYYQDKHLKSPRHPATKIFLALRIAVNDELANLQSALPQTLSILKSGGIVITISFHSGEDRIVKLFIKSHSFPASGLLKPSPAEIHQNPLSRSATLRWYKI